MSPAAARPPARARGFTLIELMVALAVFAVLSTLAYGGLRQVTRSNDALAERQAAFAALQTSLTLLQQDLENAAARPARDAFGDSVPALRAGVEGVLLELTRHAGVRHAGRGVDLRRVDYRLEGGTLYRRVWPVLDRPQAAEPQWRALLEAVAVLELEFYREGWTGFWPPAEARAQQAVLPQAARVTLAGADERVVQRTFLLRAGGR